MDSFEQLLVIALLRNHLVSVPCVILRWLLWYDEHGESILLALPAATFGQSELGCFGAERSWRIQERVSTSVSLLVHAGLGSFRPRPISLGVGSPAVRFPRVRFARGSFGSGPFRRGSFRQGSFRPRFVSPAVRFARGSFGWGLFHLSSFRPRSIHTKSLQQSLIGRDMFCPCACWRRME